MTAKAPLASVEPADARATGRPPLQLWQVPTFLLGLGCLVASWVTFHCGCTPSCWSLREVTAARQILSRPDGNVESAMALLTRVLEQGELASAQRGEVQFLLGTAQLRLADRAEPTLATAFYQA